MIFPFCTFHLKALSFPFQLIQRSSTGNMCLSPKYKEIFNRVEHTSDNTIGLMNAGIVTISMISLSSAYYMSLCLSRCILLWWNLFLNLYLYLYLNLYLYDLQAKTNQAEASLSKKSLCGGVGARGTKGLSCKSSFVDPSPGFLESLQIV